MKTAVILVLTIASQVVAGAPGELQRLDKTPGAVEVETVIQRGQQIDSLDELVIALGLDCAWSLDVEASRAISPEVTRQRLRLYFEGIKVRTFTLQASVDDDNYYTGAVSGYLPDLSGVDAADGSQVTRKQVKAALVTYVNQFSRRDQPQIDESGLDHFHFERQVKVDAATGEANVVLYAEARVSKPNLIRMPRVLFDTSFNVVKGRVFVRNAAAGNPAAAASQGCPKAKGGNERFPGLTYGSGAGQTCLATEVKGEHCCLKSDVVVVKDCKNDEDRSNAKVVRFVCADGLNDYSNGGFSPNADVFYYSGVFADVLKDWAKIDLPGKPITMYTHYGYFSNSFWDGHSATFGDGNEIVFPYAMREVIGHELGHAVVETSKNMGFDGECVAVDESFADICGKAVTAYLHASGELPSFSWNFAPNLIREGDDALRYMDEPTRDGRSVDHVNNFNEVDAADMPALGVGIFDKAFVLLVDGGVSYQDAFEVFVYANQLYWHEDTGFFDGACGVLRAAADLGRSADVYKKAFLEVGIDLCFCNLAGTA